MTTRKGHDMTDRDTGPSYRIVRMYQGDHPTETIRTGLTLTEAQAWCNDPETSSETAKGAEARARTAERGPWFDGYETEHPVRDDGWPTWETREVALWLDNSPETEQWVEDVALACENAQEIAETLAHEAPAVLAAEGCALEGDDWLAVDWTHLARHILEGNKT